MLKMSTTSTIIWRNGTSMLSWHLLGFWSYFEVLTVFPCCFEIPSDPKPEKDELCDLYVLQELCWSGRGWTHLGDLSEIDCEWQERGLWWRNAPSAIFALFSGLQHLLHECIPEKKKSHLSSSLLHSSLAFFFCTKPLRCANVSMRGWWKRKSMVWVEEKGAGEVQRWIPSKNQCEGCWWLQWDRGALGPRVENQCHRSAVSRGVTPPPAPARRDAHKITPKLQTSPQKWPEKSKWRQRLCLSLWAERQIWQPGRGDRHTSVWGEFHHGKGKAEDQSVPCRNDIPSLGSPPDLLNIYVLRQPPSRRMLQKHPLASSALSGMQPLPACKEKGFGAPKIPGKKHYAAPGQGCKEREQNPYKIPIKYTHSPAAEQIWVGKAPKSAGHHRLEHPE